jgi:crossover junction endodeoxyribonuclease RuvC
VIILGIDPGLNGGLALVLSGDRPTLLAVGDVPTTGEKAKRRVDVGAVVRFVKNREAMPDHALIERAQAMPDQGASSGFVYGRAVGALEAVVEALEIPLSVSEAGAWKKAHALVGRGKEDSRQRAIKLFPGAAGFERKLDHNRAEATLIAAYGLILLRP